MQTKSAWLPLRFCRRGAALLNLQCWLWGQDIKRAEGNLLLAYGADRLRPPAEVRGCSQYTFALAKDAVLKLWGFGFFVGGEEGFYLNRYEFLPRQAIRRDLWTPDAHKRSPRTRQWKLLPETLRWFAAYERWVLTTAGSEYRRTAALGGPETTANVQTLAEDWEQLADEIERWCTSAKPHRRLAVKASQRQLAQRPVMVNSCPVARNPRGSRGFTSTAQPSSS